MSHELRPLWKLKGHWVLPALALAYLASRSVDGFLAFVGTWLAYVALAVWAFCATPGEQARLAVAKRVVPLLPLAIVAIWFALGLSLGIWPLSRR